jgi:arylsulfatase A-like enzyme
MGRGRAVCGVVAVLAVAVSACGRTVTHDKGSYDRVLESGGASYTYPDAGNAYEGNSKAKAVYPGSNPSAHAFGELDARVADNDGTYGAAFYFPPGTLSGSSPAQTDTLDIMQWRDGSNFGGIRIGADHRARLVNGSGGEVETGKQFTLREGCWNYISVHQKLSTTDSSSAPQNEVFLNGERIVSSTKANTAAAVGAVDSVRWGLVNVGSGQVNPLTFYVDFAYLAVEEKPIAPGPGSGANVCDPLPNVLFIITDDQRVDSVDMVMPKTTKWFRDGSASEQITGGTEFAHAYTSMPMCCPARSSILTGKYPHNHGVTENRRGHPDSTPAGTANDIPGIDQDTILQRYLEDAGYANAIYGKFLAEYVIWDPEGNDPTTGQPLSFRRSNARMQHLADYGLFEGGYPDPFVREKRGGPDAEDDYFGNVSNLSATPPLPTYSTKYVEWKSIDFVNAQKNSEPGRPWSLYLAPQAPHEYCLDGTGPASGPNAWSAMTDGSAHANDTFPWLGSLPSWGYEDLSEMNDKPSGVRVRVDGNYTDPTDTTCLNGQKRVFEKAATETTPRYPGLREQQLRTLGDVDDMVENLFQQLRAAGDERNTLAVFASDNGFMWREHSPRWANTLPPECVTEGPNGVLGGAWVFGSPESGAHNCGIYAKGVPYRQSARVPLMMRWPAQSQRMPTERVYQSTLASVIDMAPTVMDAIGESGRVSANAPMDGKSLLRGGAGLNRQNLLEEFAKEGVVRWENIASLTTSNPAHEPFDYMANWVETKNPGVDPPDFEEYYYMSDLGQTESLYDGHYTPGSGEPAPPLDVNALFTCKGSSGPNPCP